MRKLLLLSAFAIAGLFFPARLEAQFIGYTSPQTVQTRVINAAIAPVAVNVQNAGQTVHALTYAAQSCSTIDIRLEASNDGTTFFAIAPVGNDLTPSSPLGGTTGLAGLTAVGYYPVVRVNLRALSGTGCTISAWYAGTSTISPSPVQTYQQTAGFRWPVAINLQTNASFFPVEIATPFGSSQGSIWLQCSAACPSGGTIEVDASPADSAPIGSSSIFTAPIATVASLQRFDVPGFLTNHVFITINPTAAGTVTWSIFYNFASFGSSGSTTANTYREINSNTSTQLRTGEGYLGAVVVNNNGSSWDFQIFDNTTCTGTAIVGGAGAVVVPASGSTLSYNVHFNTGLCVLTTSGTAGSITVSYQ